MILLCLPDFYSLYIHLLVVPGALLRQERDEEERVALLLVDQALRQIGQIAMHTPPGTMRRITQRKRRSTARQARQILCAQRHPQD